MAEEIEFRAYKVPHDEEDYHYVKSFGLDDDKEEILKFWDEFGFVVIRDILTPRECQDTVDEFWGLCETSGLNRNDPSTYDNWPSNGMDKFGMPTREPIFTKQALRNRQNPNLHKAFSILFNTESLIVSHDRCYILRPTKNVPFPDGSIRNVPKWRSPTGVHLDMNIWDYIKDDPTPIWSQLSTFTYTEKRLNNFIQENNWVHKSMAEGGVSVQGVLNLVDNYEEDGGFQCVPGFKNHFAEFVANYKGKYDPAPSLKFGPNHWLNKYSIRITLRAGSIVIWDQRTPHGGSGNNSSRIRACQFVKMYPRTTLLHDLNRYQNRMTSLQSILIKQDFMNELTPLGLSVFALEPPTAEEQKLYGNVTIQQTNRNKGRGERKEHSGRDDQGGRGGRGDRGGKGGRGDRGGKGGRRVQGAW